MFQPIIQEDFLDSYYFEYLDNWVHGFNIDWKFNNNISGKPDFEQTEKMRNANVVSIKFCAEISAVCQNIKDFVLQKGIW